MKNIFRIFSFLAIALVVFSCKNDYVPPHESVKNGGFLRFDEILLPVIDFTAIETSEFTNTLVNPGGEVTSAQLFVSIQLVDSIYDTIALRTVNSFPNNLVITAADVVDAYVAEGAAMTLDSISAGDRFNIITEVTHADGTVYTTEDFTGDLSNPGMRQAMDYTIFFSCPFARDEAVGNYLITRDDFVTSLDYASLIEAVAGLGDNEVVFLDMFKHPEAYPVIVDTDPATGVATIAKQDAWECANFGCAFGTGRVEGGGFFFSCTGFLTVNLEHTVDAGSFGTWALALQRQ